MEEGGGNIPLHSTMSDVQTVGSYTYCLDKHALVNIQSMKPLAIVQYYVVFPIIFILLYYIYLPEYYAIPHWFLLFYVILSLFSVIFMISTWLREPGIVSTMDSNLHSHSTKAPDPTEIQRHVSLLMALISNNKIDVLANILAKKPEYINCTNSEGRSLVHIAVILKKNQILEKLFSYIPDVSIIDNFGLSPLDYACYNHDVELCQRLYSFSGFDYSQQHLEVQISQIAKEVKNLLPQYDPIIDRYSVVIDEMKREFISMDQFLVSQANRVQLSTVSNVSYSKTYLSKSDQSIIPTETPTIRPTRLIGNQTSPASSLYSLSYSLSTQTNSDPLQFTMMTMELNTSPQPAVLSMSSKLIPIQEYSMSCSPAGEGAESLAEDDDDDDDDDDDELIVECFITDDDDEVSLVSEGDNNDDAIGVTSYQLQSIKTPDADSDDSVIICSDDVSSPHSQNHQMPMTSSTPSEPLVSRPQSGGIISLPSEPDDDTIHTRVLIPLRTERGGVCEMVIQPLRTCRSGSGSGGRSGGGGGMGEMLLQPLRTGGVGGVSELFLQTLRTERGVSEPSVQPFIMSTPSLSTPSLSTPSLSTPSHPHSPLHRKMALIRDSVSPSTFQPMSSAALNNLLRDPPHSTHPSPFTLPTFGRSMTSPAHSSFITVHHTSSHLSSSLSRGNQSSFSTIDSNDRTSLISQDYDSLPLHRHVSSFSTVHKNDIIPVDTTSDIGLRSPGGSPGRGMETIKRKEEENQIRNSCICVYSNEIHLLQRCPYCHIIPPPRSFHCRVCNCCIRGFDHHCQWIGNCIGVRNHLLFFGYLTTTVISCLIGSITSFVAIITIIINNKQQGLLWKQIIIPLSCYSLLLLLPHLFLIIPLASLLFYHFRIISRNLTTHEEISITRNMKKTKDKKIETGLSQHSEGGNQNWKFAVHSFTTPSQIIILMSLLLLVIGAIFTSALTREDDHFYNSGDQLYAWTNRIGPYHNPHETYDYFQLPFCKPRIPDILAVKKGGLSEIIEGTSLQNSGIVFTFAQNSPRTTLCTTELSTEQAYLMQMAISNHYWYLLEVDSLPIWAKIGDLDISEENLKDLESHGSHHDVMPEHSLLYTHRHFTFGYHEGRIVEVNMTSSDPHNVEAGKPLIFSVSSSWIESSVPFKKRFDRYLEYNFFESQVHWFSIFNSFMIVVFLAGLVALIMIRTLSLDYRRYAEDGMDGETMNRDDSGWKRVHSDIFRSCDSLTMYSVLVGNGSHVAFTLISSLISIVVVSSYIEHDMILMLIIGVFVVGFIVNGWVSGVLYKRAFYPRTSPGWQQVMIWSGMAMPITIVFAYSLLSFISLSHGSLSVFPTHNLLSLLLLSLLLCLPLQVLGTVLGRANMGNPNYPCRVAALPNPIPPAAFYAKPRFISLVSGLLPFGSIFIEVFFIFASIWSYKYYYVYGFLLSMLIILIIILVCVSIVGTYVLLNAENYHWRWTSFLSGASIGIYLFIYCIYFYMYKTEMNGIVQTTYFFIESVLLVSMISLFCGAVSAGAASTFVKRIYKNIKVE